MDRFETPYDEDVQFFECKACNKSLRGKTLYKIHLTSPAHVKKEAASVSAGSADKQCINFRDILHYLDHLKLDEPIIGLDYLEEMPCNDPQEVLSYKCKLCYLETTLEEIVRHVIGRKHRQKYMERNRPDLVNWSNMTVNSQGGKAIRAKAEIVERQDGRGRPVLLPQKKQSEGKVNVSRVAPRQKQSGNRGDPEKSVPPLIPGLKSELSHRRQRYPDSSAFHPDEPDLHRDRREKPLSRDHTKEELWREDKREGCVVRDDYINSDYHQYEGKYIEEPQRRMLLEPGNVLRYDREELHHGQGEYSEKPPTYERPYPERDRLKEFYSEEVCRGPSHSYDYPPSQAMYHEGVKQRLSMEKESSRRSSMTRGIEESSEPSTTRRNYRTPEREQSHDQLFSVVRDYHHKIREPNPKETFENLVSNKQVEVTRMFSDLPEPFRQFLKGPANDEGQGKRKRKSRFTDATPEEQDDMKNIFSHEYGPPQSKFGGDSRPVSVPLRPEISRRQYAHLDTQSPQLIESYQEASSESEGVFDMLKNIEIENVEEAYFLKSKLCSLLKEFKAKKMEKAVQNSQASTSRGYGDPQLSRKHTLERPLRGDSDHRQPDLHFRDDARTDHQQWEHVPDEQHTEYHHLAHRETRHPNRSRYEEEFGSAQTSRFDEPLSYSERFQEHARPREYQPSVAEYFDSHSAASPLHMEQDSRRTSRYSSNLDKITSTLLELVARK